MNSLHRKVVDLLKGCGGRVLDAGAGTGEISRALSDAGFEVSSCDINPAGFSYGKCRRVDLNGALPYRPANFDVVVCAEVAEHIENVRHLIREARRVLRPGGRLVVTTPNIANVFSRVKFLINGKFFCFSDEERRLGHKSPIAWWEMEDALEESGFRMERIASNAHLALNGCGGARNAMKRLLAKAAFVFLYPVMSPKNMELLKGDSLIFLARKVEP